MRVLRVLILATALAGVFSVENGAAALPVSIALPGGVAGAAEPVQAFCGPYRCFARPFWRYRSGAGFLPYRRFGFAPPPHRFAPFGFRRFGGFGGGVGGGFGGRFGGFGGRPGGFRRF